MGMMWDTVLGQRTIQAIGEACTKVSSGTLRDVFAMTAMHGLLGRSQCTEMELSDLSVSAYMLADDMLRARKLDLKVRPKESTWEKIVLEARGSQKDSDGAQAYETARNQIGNYIYEKYGINVDADYEPDKAIADFLEEHPEADSFDIDGNMNILKNLRNKKGD